MTSHARAVRARARMSWRMMMKLTRREHPAGTLRGTVIEAYLRSIAVNGQLPYCDHATEDLPAILDIEDSRPAVRCESCAGMRGTPAPDGTCCLCGHESARFTVFAVKTGNLMITGNACPECMPGISGEGER